jgi:tetratricopeptide (TPR) repeat protein
MQFTSEEPRACALCKEQAATTKYTHPHTGWIGALCAICFDRLTVQVAYYDTISRAHALRRNEQYDDALACLDELMEANRRRDPEKWLARLIAMHRADILIDAGRYAEAEHACHAWAELGFGEIWGRWHHGSVMAEALDALGRTREGLAVLEDALTHPDPEQVPSAWLYLRDLAELSEKLGRPVDPKFRSLAEETAACHGVEVPERDSLGEAILALAEIIGGKDEPGG